MLAGEDAGVSATVGLERVLDADVGARAGLDAIRTGELLDFEQVGVVEHHAARIFVGQRALGHAGLRIENLSDRRDRVRAHRAAGDPRVVDSHATRGEAARHSLAADRRPARGIDDVVEVVHIAAQVAERRVRDADWVGQAAAPLNFGLGVVVALRPLAVDRTVTRKAQHVVGQREFAA